MVHDPPIWPLILTDISHTVQTTLIIMRFSLAFSRIFALRLIYYPDNPVLKSASHKIYTVNIPLPPTSPIIK